MSDLVARCRSCGFEQTGDELPECPVCCGASAWWCGSCQQWRPERKCSACASLVVVPSEVALGSFPAGMRVPFRFTVRNRGKKDLVLPVESLHPALVLKQRTLNLLPNYFFEVVGTIYLGQLLPGPRSYRIRFGTENPVETELILEVVPLIRQLEFLPSEVVFPNALPGATCRRSLFVKNSGNTNVAVTLSMSAPWLNVAPNILELAPGGSTSVTVCVKTRKADCGEHRGRLRAASDSGDSWEVLVRVQLPTPELAADSVEFGDVRPDCTHYRRVVLRNKGLVRVACDFATDQPWLAVAPRRATLLPGKETELKLRALVPSEMAGIVQARVIVAASGAELLRIPVSAVCRNPKPVLAPIRKQSLGAIATDAATVRRFRIANAGDGALKCTISADQPWIEILTKELRVGPGKKRRIEYRVNTPPMSHGPHAAVICVESNGGAADVPVSLTVVDPDPKLEVLGDEDLGTIRADQPVSGHLSVRNVGVGLLKLHAHAEDPYVTVTPTEMTVAPGPPVKLAVLVAIGNLDGGPQRVGVRFTSNGGSGRANLRFRVPIEQIDAADELDLGDLVAGRRISEAVRVRNIGTDRITLAVRAEHPWVTIEANRVVVKPGDVVEVPFRVEVPDGASGPIFFNIWLEGRKLRHAVAVRAVARKIDLVVIPSIVMLGSMRPGEERAFSLHIVNRGEMAAVINDSHTRGELEVWLPKQVVEPGETVTLTARVRMNSRAIGQEFLTPVSLADQGSVLFTATVARSRAPRIAAGVAFIGGLATGLFAAIGNWNPGWSIAIVTTAIGLLILLMNRGKK